MGHQKLSLRSCLSKTDPAKKKKYHCGGCMGMGTAGACFVPGPVRGGGGYAAVCAALHACTYLCLLGGDCVLGFATKGCLQICIFC